MAKKSTKSMTAFGQASSPEFDGCNWQIEIHSVNRKVLDIQVHMPREFLQFDLEIRKMISDKIKRGQITVKIVLKRAKAIAANVKTLKTLKTQWEKIAKELGYKKETIDFTFLLTQSASTPMEMESTKQQTYLYQTLEKALKQLLQMKEEEGIALSRDLEKRFKLVSNAVQKMEKISDQIPEKFRSKLVERMEEALKHKVEDERIFREVALFAEKVDITEELVRLKSHIEQSLKLLHAPEDGVGRTLEFLMQEILRETNTIGAKSTSLEISELIISSKIELEKIREQLQNIE